MIYTIPIAIIILSYFIVSPLIKHRLIKEFVLLTFSMSFVIIASFRFRTGTDWQPYFRFFNQSSYNSMLTHYFELFYKLLAVLVKIIFDNYTVFLFIVSMFFVVEAYSIFVIAEEAFEKYSLPILLLSTYMFCFPNFMGGQRQAIASALCILSLKYLIKEKWYVSFFILVCAVLFHTSAIIFVINWFIYYLVSDEENKLFRVNTMSLILFVSILFGFAYLLLSNISSFTSYNSILIAKLIAYQGMSGVDISLDYGMRNFLLISERVLLNLILVFGLNFYRKTRVTKFIFSSYTFATVFYIFFIFTARNIAGRGIDYFRFSDMLVLATLPQVLSYSVVGEDERNRSDYQNYIGLVIEKLFEFLFVVYIIARFIVIVLYANSIFYLPYRSVFSTP